MEQFKDFLRGKCVAVFTTDSVRRQFLYRLDNLGITWYSGDIASDYDIPINKDYYLIRDNTDGFLYYGDIDLALDIWEVTYEDVQEIREKGLSGLTGGKPKIFRKKPVYVDAIQYLREDNIQEVQDFVGESLKYSPSANEYYIITLEGSMLCTKGDYIIRGVNGEYYPCKPDIFEKTYELVI